MAADTTFMSNKPCLIFGMELQLNLPFKKISIPTLPEILYTHADKNIEQKDDRKTPVTYRRTQMSNI